MGAEAHLVFAPEGGSEGHEEGEDFQTAGDHQERGDVETAVVEFVPRVEGADGITDAGADVGEGRNAQTQRVEERKPHDDERTYPDGDEQDEETGVGKDGLHHVCAEFVLIDAQREHSSRVENAAKLVADDFDGREYAHHLDAAGRTSRAGTDHTHG